MGLGAGIGLVNGGWWIGFGLAFGDAGASLTTGEALGDTDGDGLTIGIDKAPCPPESKPTTNTTPAAAVVITIFERVDAGLFFIFIFSCAVSANVIRLMAGTLTIGHFI